MAEGEREIFFEADRFVRNSNHIYLELFCIISLENFKNGMDISKHTSYKI